MKKQLLIYLFAAFSLTVSAQDKIVVHGTAGTETDFSLDEVRKITFGDDMLSVVLLDGGGSSFNFGDVRKLTFGNGTSGIGQTVSTKGRLSLRSGRGYVSVEGIDGTCRMAIYSVDGRLVAQSTAWDGSRFSTENLKPGMYVLVAGKDVFKFLSY